MNEVHSRFLSAFAGGSIVTGVIMEKLYSYQNILLSIVLGLATGNFKQFQQYSENSFSADLRNKIHYGFVSFNEHTLYLSGN